MAISQNVRKTASAISKAVIEDSGEFTGTQERVRLRIRVENALQDLTIAAGSSVEAAHLLADYFGDIVRVDEG